jgi:hypothetical protein
MLTSQQVRALATTIGDYLANKSPFQGLLPDKFLRNPKDLFFYTAEFTPLNSLATATVQVQTNTDAAFLMMGAVRRVTSTDNQTDVAFFPCLLNVKDSTSGRDIMDRPVHLENFAGTAQLPAILPFPKWIPAGSTILTTAQSLDSANNRNLRLSYFGFKVYA